MGVYVDAPIYPFYGRNGRKMMMCHMVADTLAELHDMAEKLGVRAYFQACTRYPHYDICKSKRTQALALGALPCPDRKTLITKARGLRSELTRDGGEVPAQLLVSVPDSKMAMPFPEGSLPVASSTPSDDPVQIELLYSSD